MSPSFLPRKVGVMFPAPMGAPPMKVLLGMWKPRSLGSDVLAGLLAWLLRDALLLLLQLLLLLPSSANTVSLCAITTA